jgi:cytochrome b subunit of formate dehydrogenase
MSSERNHPAPPQGTSPEQETAGGSVRIFLDRDPLPAPSVEVIPAGAEQDTGGEDTGAGTATEPASPAPSVQVEPAGALPVSDHPLVIPGERPRVKRHGFSARFVHWSVALSTIALLFSGFGQMPMYARYKVDQLPFMGWASNYDVVIVMHYVAAAVLALAVTYHIALHAVRRDFDILPRRGDLKESYLIIKAMFGRGEEPPSDKYLAEQRVAYAFIGGSLLLVLVTGYVKVVKNLSGVEIPFWLLWTSTTLHNLATFLIIFGVLGHLAAFMMKENRKLLGGIFHGKVDLEYAQHRHCHWCERLGITHERSKEIR